MKLKNIKLIVLLLSGLFIGALVLDACAASKPGFNSGKKKGKKVKSSGKMY